MNYDDISTWLYLLAIAIAVAGIFVAPVLARRHGRRDAEAWLRTQYQVIDDEYLGGLKKHLDDPAKARTIDALVQAVRSRGYALRKAHVFWMLSVLDGRGDANEVPQIVPPADLPYDPTLDPAAPQLRRFFLLVANGEPVTAYRILRECAEAGSPMAMVYYGCGLLEEKVPGVYEPASGLPWLERAVRETGGTFGRDSLGVSLLRHGTTTADRERGLALLEEVMRESERYSTLQWELVEIYEHGLYGVPRDREKALAWSLVSAPPLRRLAYRLGIGPSAVVEMHRYLAIAREVRAEVSAQPGTVTQRQLRELLERARHSDA